MILNALRRKEELRVTATAQERSAATDTDPSGVQNVPAAADREPEAELPSPPPAQMQQVDGTMSSTPSRGSSSPQAYDEFEDNHYSEDRQERGARRPQMRPVGKADKPLAWKGSSIKGGKNSPLAFRHGTTEAQAILKVYQMFKEARETAAADSLTTYLLLGSNIPSFSHILYDIDNLFKVNHVSNALDIINKLNLKSSSATEAVAKIEKLSKLVIGGNVTIKDIFMAQAIKDNIPDGAKIALINTLAYLDRETEIMWFTEFKST